MYERTVDDGLDGIVEHLLLFGCHAENLVECERWALKLIALLTFAKICIMIGNIFQRPMFPPYMWKMWDGVVAAYALG